MTISRFSVVILASALTACEDTPSEPPPHLSAEQQASRTQLCMAEIESWRSRGVWIHGGAEPSVHRDAWVSLSGGEKQQIADIAACIDSAGAFETRNVQIVSEGFKVPIVKIASENRLFVNRFRGGKS